MDRESRDLSPLVEQTDVPRGIHIWCDPYYRSAQTLPEESVSRKTVKRRAWRKEDVRELDSLANSKMPAEKLPIGSGEPKGRYVRRRFSSVFRSIRWHNDDTIRCRASMLHHDPELWRANELAPLFTWTFVECIGDSGQLQFYTDALGQLRHGRARLTP
jgi:hypothetical protein